MVCAVLSALSKEVGLTILAVAPIFERVSYFGSWRELWKRRYPAYLILGVAFAGIVAWVTTGVRMTELRGAGGFWDEPGGYLTFQISALAKYLRLVVWPHPMIFISYPPGWEDPAKWIPSLLFLLVVGGLALYLALKVRWVRLSMAVFLGVLALTTSILPIPLEPYAEFRMYLPSLAAIVVLVGLGGILLARWARAGHARHARHVWILLAVICLAAGLVSRARNRLYAVPSRLWEDVVRQEATNGKALANLGTALIDEGDLRGAAGCGRLLIQLGRSTGDEELMFAGRRQAGLVALESGRPEKAVSIFKALAERLPNDERIRTGLIRAQVRSGRSRRAREIMDQSFGDGPLSPTIEVLEAEVLIAEGAFREAS